MTGRRSSSHVAVACEPFGLLDDGRVVERFILVCEGGLEVSVLSYGGIVQSLRLPDGAAGRTNVVLGFDNLGDYLAAGDAYFGAIIGRYANRIAGGAFSLAGATHRLSQNEGRHHLHGGVTGFDKRIWCTRVKQHGTAASLVLSLSSEAGDEGYPGNLDAEVTYTLRDGHTFRIDYRAKATTTTVVNLTNHSLFNLAGEGVGSVLAHELEIYADAFTPVNKELIPTGDVSSVAGTPLDFRTPKKIELAALSPHEQTARAGGCDHNYVLRERHGLVPKVAARLTEPRSGRTMEVRTTEPGLQIYSGNRLDGRFKGSGGRRYERFAGVAFETQHFPDSPNQPGFPSTTLRPGEELHSATEFAFHWG